MLSLKIKMKFNSENQKFGGSKDRGISAQVFVLKNLIIILFFKLKYHGKKIQTNNPSRGPIMQTSTSLANNNPPRERRALCEDYMWAIFRKGQLRQIPPYPFLRQTQERQSQQRQRSHDQENDRDERTEQIWTERLFRRTYENLRNQHGRRYEVAKFKILGTPLIIDPKD
ncbi:unnamed protein product [Paramecium pentaurelia]|uniref:Uncharacterized protein n=1 Tax=Paramecium pentaurelia TaxID=43138 RepID=A0A8S1U5E4_9CILI|nr:unnamed protein product [Paramecium pentaurelia]